MNRKAIRAPKEIPVISKSENLGLGGAKVEGAKVGNTVEVGLGVLVATRS